MDNLAGCPQVPNPPSLTPRSVPLWVAGPGAACRESIYCVYFECNPLYLVVIGGLSPWGLGLLVGVVEAWGGPMISSPPMPMGGRSRAHR